MIARLYKPMMIVAGLLLFAAIGNLLAIKRLDGYHVYKALKERGRQKKRNLGKGIGEN